MNVALVTAFISASGVIASAAIAFFMARKQAKTEIKKVRLQVSAVYVQALHNKRMEIYPAFYSIFADLGSLIIKKNLTPKDLQDAMRKIINWDREYALFLSPLSVKTLINLRKSIALYGEIQPQELSQNRIKNNLRPLLIEMQRCLKSEIGVFDADGYHNAGQTKTLFQSILGTDDIE